MFTLRIWNMETNDVYTLKEADTAFVDLVHEIYEFIDGSMEAGQKKDNILACLPHDIQNPEKSEKLLYQISEKSEKLLYQIFEKYFFDGQDFAPELKERFSFRYFNLKKLKSLLEQSLLFGCYDFHTYDGHTFEIVFRSGTTETVVESFYVKYPIDLVTLNGWCFANLGNGIGSYRTRYQTLFHKDV